MKGQDVHRYDAPNKTGAPKEASRRAPGTHTHQLQEWWQVELFALLVKVRHVRSLGDESEWGEGGLSQHRATACDAVHVHDSAVALVPRRDATSIRIH